MAGCHERIRRGEDLAFHVKRPKGDQQRDGGVVEQADEGNLEIAGELGFQLLVHGAAVRQPAAFPYFFKIGGELRQGRKMRFGNINGLV